MINELAVGDFEFAALNEARNYRTVLVREFAPFLSGRVAEIGAGIGQMTAEFQALPNVGQLTAVEPDSRFHSEYVRRNPSIPLVRGTASDIPDKTGWNSIVAINVLEHIEHDEEELKVWHSLVAGRGGYVCLFIPARPEIYAPIDKDFGHYRRYTKPELRRKLTAAGFTIVRLYYFNWLGYFAWLVKFRWLGQRTFDVGSVRTFDRYLLPVVYGMESNLCRPPFGQSLIAIGQALPTRQV